MTLTATAAPEQYANPIRVRVDVNSTVMTRRAVSINRVHPDGSRWPVILEPDPRLSSGAWAGFDYHSPASQRVTYEVTAGTETATSNPVTQVTTQVRLQHPTTPGLSLAALFVPEGGLGDPTNETTAGVFDIVGSDLPVVVTDETIRRTASISLAFTPAQTVHNGPLTQLLRNGGPLLLNAPVRTGWGVSWLWLQRTTATVKTPGKTAGGGNAGYPHRVLDMAYVVVDQPRVSNRSPWDYTTLKAGFASFDAMEAVYADFEALKTNTRTG